LVRFIRTLFRLCRELYTLNEYNVQNKCWKLNLNFTKSYPVRCCSLICLVSTITQKKDKLQAKNILDILQIKQVRNEIYKRTKSERKALFFRILLFIELNIIVYDLTEDTQSLVKPYTHFMFIGSTWMHTVVTQVKLITGMCR
jgi:hypothetical protein